MENEMRKHRNEQIIELYKCGVGIGKIADETGVTKDTVTRVVRRAVEDGLVEPRRPTAGKPRPAKGQGKGYTYEKKGYFTGIRSLPFEQQKELVDDYTNKGMGYKDLMAKYGIWQKSIKHILKVWGVPPHPRGRKYKEVKNDIRESN